MQWPILLIAMTMLNSAGSPSISIHARGSLSLRQGEYASLFFVADPERTPDNDLPVQYRFTESGATPAGMKFETYPCNRPGQKACPQIATANGVYLDGAPAETGSYTFVITAGDGNAEVSKEFTVTVNK